MTKIYLSAFDWMNTSEETKAGKLFSLIASNPDIEEDEIKKAFEPITQNAFDLLVSHLKEKIGFSLVSEINTLRANAYSKRYQAIFESRHKLSLIDIYLNRGLHEEAYNNLTKLIKMASEYEVYTELVEALYIKRNFLNLRTGTNDFVKITADIKFYEDCKLAYIKAEYWFNVHISFLKASGYRSGYMETIVPAIHELEKEYEKTKSANVAYYLYLIKIDYYQRIKEFETANENAKTLLNLVTKNIAIRQPRRMGTAYINIAHTYIYLYKFNSALKNVKLAQEHYKTTTFNYSVTQDLEFLILFYIGQYQEAEKIICSIIENTNYKQSIYIDNKRLYYYSCLLFAQGKYDESQKVLDDVEQIHQDKKGWNIGIRILRILTNEMTGKKDITLYNVYQLKQQIYNLKLIQEARKRDILIFRILYDWVINKHNFKSIYQKRKKDFDLLASDDPDFGWEINSHELVIFHEWFKAMASKKKYEGDLSRQILKKEISLN